MLPKGQRSRGGDTAARSDTAGGASQTDRHGGALREASPYGWRWHVSTLNDQNNTANTGQTNMVPSDWLVHSSPPPFCFNDSRRHLHPRGPHTCETWSKTFGQQDLLPSFIYRFKPTLCNLHQLPLSPLPVRGQIHPIMWCYCNLTFSEQFVLLCKNILWFITILNWS